MNNEADININDSWDRAVYCYGTAKILEIKIRNMSRKNTFVKFLGLALPLFIGSVVFAFNKDVSYLPVLLNVAGFISIIQISITLWALFNHWDGKLEIFMGSKLTNLAYSEIFRDIALRYNNDAKYKELYNETKTKDDIQRTNDNKYSFSKKELHLGMRYGLYQFQRKCVKCNVVPNPVKPTLCEVCGK